MKFILSLAALAIYANGLDLEAEIETGAGIEVLAEIGAEVEGPGAYDGPIVPENYGHAVHEFDIESPFTDQECYQKQVDIYSD